MNEVRLDPWGKAQIGDYEELIRTFGIEPFEPLLGRIPRPMRLMARRIIFGHRDYGRVLDAMGLKKPFGVISGFMPSGQAHLGAKMVMEEMVWHQKMGGDATVAIADMEAHAVRGIPREKCWEWGINEYVLSLVALGLKPDRAKVYFQSENRQVQDLAFQLAKEANYSELKAIYGFTGETTLAHMLCPAVQAADILAPQLAENGGPRPLVVPVGVDQDPHIRLARDLAARVDPLLIERHPNQGTVRGRHEKTTPMDVHKVAERYLTGSLLREYPKKDPEGLKLGAHLKAYHSIVKFTRHESHFDFDLKDWDIVETVVGLYNRARGGFNFIPPASIYHRFMSGLTGGKMSSSVPESYIALSEPPKEAEAKVLKAKTGGRATEAEQREKGGEPHKCTVYELMRYHLEDEKGLKDMYQQCVSGSRLCGPCKKWAAGEMRRLLEEHAEKRGVAEGKLDEFGLKPVR